MEIKAAEMSGGKVDGCGGCPFAAQARGSTTVGQ